MDWFLYDNGLRHKRVKESMIDPCYLRSLGEETLKWYRAIRKKNAIKGTLVM